MKALMALPKALAPAPAAMVVLAARSETASTFVVSHGSAVQVDAKDVLVASLGELGVRGGGRPHPAPGAGPGGAALPRGRRAGAGRGRAGGAGGGGGGAPRAPRGRPAAGPPPPATSRTSARSSAG